MLGKYQKYYRLFHKIFGFLSDYESISHILPVSVQKKKSHCIQKKIEEK